MIIEQRSSSGGSIVRRYIRGKFLGKVLIIIYRVDLQSVIN
jgi:hypothetical protein